MATVEKSLKEINGKLKLLKFIRNDTPRILEKKSLKAMERHLKVFENKIEESHELRARVQEFRIENGDEPEEIRKWSLEIENEIADYEGDTEELNDAIKRLREQALRDARGEEEAIEEQRRQRQYEQEIKHEEAKLEVRKEIEKRLEETREKSLRGRNQETKLPKLVITKFDGTHLDWNRFWSQFEAGIDKTDIGQVAKFSYLKELLIPKVRRTVDGLPFNTEGYERAKHLLKAKYGKPSEVINAHVQNVMSLPTIQGTQPKKVHEFYDRLVTNIQSLETMGKIREINGYVRLTLDKLPGIRADLVRIDDDWQEWGFPQMTEALRKWCERNPVPPSDQGLEYASGERGQHRSPRRERVFQAKQQDGKPRPCVYCDSSDHKSIDCKKVTSVAERKKQLSIKKLCFNCTGARHRALDCRSKSNCQKCNGKHHTSICDRDPNGEPSPIMIATGKGAVIYPVVVVKVDGVKCRALLDSGAGSSYASAELINRLGKRPIRKEYKRIDMMLHSTNQRIEIFNVDVSSLQGDFNMAIPVNKVDRAVLLSLPNPRYAEVLHQHHHLEGVVMDDVDKKPELPIHLILGASEYSSIKTCTKPRIGQPGEPVAELTTFGWAIMSPGAEVNGSNIYLTRTSSAELEQLCSLDVLGLEDRPAGDQRSVYEEFKEQLTQSSEGWYETGLIWKNNGGPLQTNKNGSLGRLTGLVTRLQREPALVDRYDEIIQDQLARGIVERASEEPKGREFYIPHKPVVRESAESTKMRIVFDASARANEKSLSLNDCLETGPPLQNLLWSVLVRMRFKPVALCGDLKQAFLQVRIRKEDRDALQFHWIKNKNPHEVEVLRFTRVPFGLVQSPFLLGGTIEQHLENSESKYPSEVEGETLEQTLELKETAVKIFGEAQFELHKWHSNVLDLEACRKSNEEEQSYAKQQLGVKADETKMLGLTWNKADDTLGVTFPRKAAEGSKREILRFLASIFDPLGLASPIALLGKFVYRDTCDQHLPWDGELPPTLLKQWKMFEKYLPDKVEVPRSLATFQESIESIDLHTFGDTSGVGTAAVVYAVVHQESGTTAGLITAKSRLELVSAHMAANLVQNVKVALKGYPVRDVYGWLDSTVALHWIRGGGSYKQFVANRVQQITAKDYIQWRHVGTDENPADVGSRGRDASKVPKMWWKGPDWLLTPDHWPNDCLTQPSTETEAEAKLVREVLAATVETEDNLDEILEKHGFWKTIRITAWIARYLHNCRSKQSQRLSGPLTTAETEDQIQMWIKRVQTRHSQTDQFKEDQLRLNLQKDEQGLYECRGRIQGDYPIYLPPDSPFSKKMVMDAHTQTLHGGVGLTMAFIRRKYWIPRLRQLTKKVIRSCFGCKRFQVTAFSSPPPGNLPADRTEGSAPFQVLGADYAGRIAYKLKPKKEGKAYILLFACSLTRAIHLELLPDQTKEEFIRSVKRFIARRGRPQKIYTDNGRSFIGAAKWLKKVMKDEQFQNYLAHHNIKWQFNLSRAPWWGGQFERMVGLVKGVLHKSTGRALLRWSELEEVILEVEVTLNNRPLGYVEDDVQLPTLTPNVMLFGQPNLLPEEDVDSIEDTDLRKRARYLRQCKDAL